MFHKLTPDCNGEMFVEEKQEGIEDQPDEKKEGSSPETAHQKEDLHPTDKDSGSEMDEEELISGELFPKRGCLRACLTPIIAILLVILVVGMIIHAKRNVLNEWLIQRIVSNTQNQVLRDLPKGMDKKAIEASFEKVKIALEEGKIDEQALKEAIGRFLSAMQETPAPEQMKVEIDRLMADMDAAIITPKDEL